ncbi:MAG TPA: fatty acid oxidation complex subunit alpha FadB [Steroidobacteraceae bacterium]|nr:fatty acid oxidation complex subunit alpha FadB [Steroidobacteraceae bacterium]
MYTGSSIRVRQAAEGIAELCFDRANETINKFDARTVEELRAATEVIRKTPGIRGVLVTSAKDVFIVGADIFEFTALFAKPEAEIVAFSGGQSRVFSSFEDLDMPIVTAINGYALGGGLEMALAADARVMSEAAQIGLPEVSLGLFPGFGGTVRLPRVAGAAVAIEWISSGKPQNARSALAAGVVERVVAPEAVRGAALELLHSLIASGEWRARRQKRHGGFANDTQAFEKAKAALAKSAAREPAALAAVELIERCAPLSRDDALTQEIAGFARIARTQAAASLVQLFMNDQAIKKKVKGYAKVARKVQSAAVIGAGIMGGGISYTSAVRGVPVVMKDIAQGALDLGVSEAKKQLTKQVESGKLKQDQADAVLGSIRPTLEYAGLEKVDVVVEAVVEKMGVKKAVLAEVEKLVAPATILASNTSSLSIAEMASVLKRPHSFVGMHFFNPVPVMPLVEVIRGPETSDEAAATVAGYASAMGKTPIVVKECPGFLVNRVLTPYLLGFLRAVQDGADYQALDRVMETFGWPMGPAYLQDVIGLDTMEHVLEVIATGFASRMHSDAPKLVHEMVRLGRLGQKSGSGFYKYERDPRGKPKKSVDPQIGPVLAAFQKNGTRSFTDDELRERLMLPMIIESMHCLEDEIVESPAEVDTALLMGLGFPRYAGGALKYADWLGMRNVVPRCEAYAALGPLYAPTAGMRALAKSGGKVYST